MPDEKASEQNDTFVKKICQEGIDKRIFLTYHIFMIREKTHPMSRLRVKELAEARGWNVPRLSQEAKVPQTVIWEIWRNPERNTTKDVLDRIAAALSVKTKDLFEDDQPGNSTTRDEPEQSNHK